MKNVAYTPSKTRHVVTKMDRIEARRTSLIRRQNTPSKNATRRDGNGHDRGMKNVGDTSSKKRPVLTRRHVEKNNFWTDDVDEL